MSMLWRHYPERYPEADSLYKEQPVEEAPKPEEQEDEE
jgi:hypothetical protein